MGLIYLIHFEKPLAHARHYIGFVDKPRNLMNRMAYHKAGRGSKLMKAVTEAGIDWGIVRKWEGDRHMERRKKNRGAAGICPICKLKAKRKMGNIIMRAYKSYKIK